MPKRLIWFLVMFCLVIGWVLVTPILNRADLERQSITTTPSPSPYGYKALYLLMSKRQGKQVSLWEHSMMNLPLNTPQTLWFLEPGSGMFYDGKAYTRRMQELVKHGYHLVFVLNHNSLNVSTPEEQATQKNKPFSVLDYLNRWYALELQYTLEDAKETLDLSVISHFDNRQIERLRFEQPKLPESKLVKMLDPNLQKQLHQVQEVHRIPQLMTFIPSSIEGGDVLLETQGGEPLVVQFERERGSVPVVLNGFFFKNGQLDKADNAALAVALQELFPQTPIRFEVYSSGFNQNRDILTYLAYGKGVAFLITVCLLLIAFALLLINRPKKRVQLRVTSDERYFTQEHFIGSLAQHYLSTQDYNTLYKKLLDHFQTELNRRYPHVKGLAQREAIAQNPFVGVSLKELEAIFNPKSLSSESAFLQQSQHLLEVQRKVCQYEHHATRNRADSTTAIHR